MGVSETNTGGASVSAPRLVRGAVVVAFICAAAMTFYFGAWSDKPLPDHWVIVGFNDIVLHLSAFSCLAFLGLLMWGKYIPVLGILFLAGIGIEMIQMVKPHRDGSLDDIAANAAGILLGALVYSVLRYLTPRFAAAWGRHKQGGDTL
jgi:hypothetical protein